MNRKLFTILLAAMLLIGCIAVGSATTDGVATFQALQDAVNAYAGAGATAIKLTADIGGDETLSVTKDVYLDLNGFDITCPVSVTSGTLYCMDSQTDDYTVEDTAGYGKLTNVTSGIAAVPEEATCAEDGYLLVKEGTDYSFHRVNLKLKSMSLRSENVGLYYKSYFAGDEKVAANVAKFGIALSVTAVPTAENLETDCKYSEFTDFKAGLNDGDTTSTLLKNVMKTSNATQINNRNSEIPVYGRPYILTKGGSYLFGSCKQRSLVEQVKLAAKDDLWKTLTTKQVDAAVSMYRNYKDIMRSWKVTNIESALCLDKSDPLFTLEDGANIKVLALTSSFGLNTTQMLYDVIMAEAEAQGITLGEVTVARLYASGCTLQKHVTNAPDGEIYEYYKVTNDPNDPLCTTPGKMMHLFGLNLDKAASMRYGMNDEEWDIIFTQQGAAQAPQLDSYLDSNGQDYIDQWKALLDQYKPKENTRFIWNMLWGYQSDSTISPFPTIFKGDQMYMYQCNIDAVMEYVVPRTDFDRIIPTGTVIQNARTSEFGDNLCRDTYHLNNYGGIMAAYGLYAVITGQEITGIHIDPVYTTVMMGNGIGGAIKINVPLTETQKAIIKESVNNALKNPFGVTESKYPQKDYSSYTYTENLKFIDNTSYAVCPACDAEVLWTEVTQENHETLGFGTQMDSGHYHFYLSEDVKYTGSANAFIQSPGGSRTFCLHLNGNNLTATNHAISVTASTTVVNIMGTGTVSGNHTNSSKFRGSAIVLNSGTNGNNLGTVRLYSGTYVQPESNTQLAPVATAGQGGLLEIYEDAVIYGNTNSVCLYTTNGKDANGNPYTETANVYGGTFYKPFYTYAGSTTTSATSLNISGGTFKDGVKLADGNTNVTLSGAPVIEGSGLVLPEGVTVTLGELTTGANIAVDASGAFTVANTKAADYLQHFSPVADKKITVSGNVLSCVPALYTKNLQFEEGTTTALCPACNESVTWIEINQDNVQSYDVANGTGYFGSTIPSGTYHLYLSEDVEYTATDANKGNALLQMNASSRYVCLHLNGNDLTATNCAIASLAGTSELNIMGTGTVTGNHTNSAKYRGSAIILNAGTTTKPGTIRLYSGTYVQPAGSTQMAPVSTAWQAGMLEIYEDAALIGNSNNYSLCVNTTNGNATYPNKYIETVNIYGGTFTRPVYCYPSDAKYVTPLTSLNISGGVFNDGIQIVGSPNITLSGMPVIKGAGLQLEEGVTVTLGELTTGAKIAVNASGAFTAANSNAANYLQYFSPAANGLRITESDNILSCTSSIYATDLAFEEGTTALCPACNESAEWIEVNESNLGTLTGNGYFGSSIAAGTYHFYLSSDIAFTADNANNAFLYAPGDGRNICLHLSGNDLTATNCAIAILAGNSKLNIMGTGTVSGNHTHSSKFRGSAIILNSGKTGDNLGTVRLYSGTYVQPADNTQLAPVSTSFQGGLLEIYEDATIYGNANSVCLNAANNNAGLTASYTETVNIYGGTFYKPVYAKAFSTSIANTTLNVYGGTFLDGINIVDTYTTLNLSEDAIISGSGLIQPEETTS